MARLDSYNIYFFMHVKFVWVHYELLLSPFAFQEGHEDPKISYRVSQPWEIAEKVSGNWYTGVWNRFTGWYTPSVYGNGKMVLKAPKFSFVFIIEPKPFN